MKLNFVVNILVKDLKIFGLIFVTTNIGKAINFFIIWVENIDEYGLK